MPLSEHDITEAGRKESRKELAIKEPAGEVTPADIESIALPAAEQRKWLRKNIVEGLKNAFPIEGARFSLHIENPTVVEKDYAPSEQKDALLAGKTLAEPIKAIISIKDKEGNVVDRSRSMTVLNLPWLSDRYTYIVGGNEYVIPNQVRLKPGVYARRRGNEELEAMFNLSKGGRFRISMDPASGIFSLEREHAKIPLYPILHNLGINHQQMADAWGPALADKNKEKTGTKDKVAVSKLYARVIPEFAHNAELDTAGQVGAIKEYLENTRMDPDVNKMTLGLPHDRIKPETFLAASGKLLSIFKNQVETDDRNSLAFKTIHSGPDFLYENLGFAAKELARKLKFKLDRAGHEPKVSDVVPPSMFTPHLRKFITSSDIKILPTQINPVEIEDVAHKVTSLGEGGIASENAIPDEARDIHPTHLGILDPIRTSEGGAVGIDIRSTIGAFRDRAGNLYSTVLNKKGELENISALELYNKVTAFPGGKPEDTHIDCIHQGQIVSKPRSEIDYFIPHPHFLYSQTTNLIPFPESSQGNRLIMGSKMQTQALSLKDREVPLIQVASWRKGRTMEKELGDLMIPSAPVSGTIKKIDKDYIYIYPDKQKHAEEEKIARKDEELVKIPYYTDFPFTTKSYITHSVTVKEGDHVDRDQHLAESNYTKDGHLALGKNMRAGFLAYHGLNSNDGIVISESAAKKLTSLGMYKRTFEPDDATIPGKKAHKAHFGTKYTNDQYDKLDDDGVIKKGTIVHPDDPLFVSLYKTQPTAEDLLLGHLSRTLMKPYRDNATTWDGEHPGKIVDVIKTPSRTTVTVQTEEPVLLGDKLCYDEETEILTDIGWKKIADVSLEDNVCTLQANDKIEYLSPDAIYHYPVGGRMYHIKSQQVDLLVTEDHNMYVRGRDEAEFKLVPAKELFGKRIDYKKDGEWVGQTPTYFEFPAITITAGQGGAGQRILPPLKMKSQTFLMLLGAFLSEGNIIDNRRSGNYGLQITQIKADNRIELESALIDSGLRYTVRPDRYVIYSKQLMEYFRQFGHARYKFIPPELFSWAKEDLQVLFKWLMWGNGHSRNSKPIVYTTTSRRLADDVQRLALHIGKAANIVKSHNAGWELVRGKSYWCRDCWGVRIVNTKLTPTVNHGHVHTQKIQVEEFIENYDKPVHCLTVPGHVVYVRRNGKSVWSGNCGRYGNKGIVSAILPDAHMIRGEDGKPLDVLLTSAGVISRVNPSQVLELGAAKVAEKIGHPIAVESFSGRNNVEWVRGMLKEHGLKDKETVTDPVSGRKIPGIAVGPMYIFRLFKTTKSNYSARGVDTYDVNEQPTRGGEEGSKAMARMEIAALVAHNARNILKENSVLKSQKNDEFWQRYRLGLPLPVMKPAFAFDKFTAMLQAAGIKIDKHGDNLLLSPMTDKDILKLSNGAVQNGEFIRSKDLRPTEGGFFDPSITGGLTGTKWSHIELPEPIVNPVFYDSARRLLGMTSVAFDALVREKGAKHIQKLLSDINLTAYDRQLHKTISTATGAKKDDAVKQLKYIRALKENKQTPDKAWILNNIAVIPPIMRPIKPGYKGRLEISDANQLYRDVILASDAVKGSKELPESDQHVARNELINSVEALYGLREPVSPQNAGRGVKGFLSLIAGVGSPKYGYFQGKVLRKNLDLTGRATLAPDINLGMDEIGIPEDMLWHIYEPFITKRLVHRGYSAMDSKKMLEDRHPAARDMLMAETKVRPVMYNRAPTLHRWNIVAGYPVPVPGKTIRLPATWAEKGLGADYDGDTGTIMTPVMPEAVEEAKNMVLSKMVLGDRDKSLMIAPEQEAVIGVYKATATQAPPNMAPQAAHSFDTWQDAFNAYKSGKISIHTPVHIKT